MNHAYPNQELSNQPVECSFYEPGPDKLLVYCKKPVFNKKKQLCRSHNYHVYKKFFSEYLKYEGVSTTASWDLAWEQSGDWQYFWNMAKEEEEKSKREVDKKEAKPKNKIVGWNKIKKKSLGEVPQTASPNIRAPELAPADKRCTGRTKQLGLKVKESTYQLLKDLAHQEKCLMTEILEKSLVAYTNKKTK